MEKFKKTNNLFSIKKEEDELNNPGLILNVPILTSEMPKIIGIEEPFEFKRRFTSVKCMSGKLVAQRIKVYDLLKLLLVYKEFNYAKKILNVIVQRKLILIEAIKGQMKLSASIFEKQIDYKYNNLINQNEDSDKKFAAIKLKGWNNGIYLDNILDTNLYLFKPKTERIINIEREKRFQMVKALSNDKQDKNIKKANKTYQKIYEENSKDSFLLMENRDFCSHRERNNNSCKKTKNNEKSLSSTKFHKKKLMSFLEDIEKINSKKKSESNNKKILINKDKIVTDLNLKIKKSIKGKRVNKLYLSKIFSNFGIKNNHYIKNEPNIESNLFAFTIPLNTNIRNINKRSDYQFNRLISLLEKESQKKNLIKNHKFDKKAFPAIFSQMKKMSQAEQ